MVKSTIELLEALEVLFPEREVDAIFIESADFQWICLLLNLAWLRACQMILIRLTKAALTTILH